MCINSFLYSGKLHFILSMIGLKKAEVVPGAPLIVCYLILLFFFLLFPYNLSCIFLASVFPGRACIYMFKLVSCQN